MGRVEKLSLAGDVLKAEAHRPSSLLVAAWLGAGGGGGECKLKIRRAELRDCRDPRWGVLQASDCILPICRKHRNTSLAFIYFQSQEGGGTSNWALVGKHCLKSGRPKVLDLLTEPISLYIIEKS